jgi:hypothetical protein
MKTIERRDIVHRCVIAILYGMCLAYGILLLLVKLVDLARGLTADALEVLHQAVHLTEAIGHTTPQAIATPSPAQRKGYAAHSA